LALGGGGGMMPRPPMQPDRHPSQSEVQQEIRAFIAGWFRDGQKEGLEADTPLVTSGIVDSAGVLEVVEFLEHQYGIKITDSDVSLRNCNTLAALTDLVLGKMA
jgi:acyl carrier protein